jgi:anti-sigma B factor antagonist
MKSGLSITEEASDGVYIIGLAGFLDGHTFIEFERKLDALFKNNKNRLVVDLGGLTYIASAGVGAFINGQHQAKKRGGSLQLANAGPNIQEIFDILGLESIFTIHPTVLMAVKAAKV